MSTKLSLGVYYPSLFLIALMVCPAGQMACAVDFPARIELGGGAGQFFDPASGFVDGVDTTHTNSVSFNDGIVQLDITLTVEAIGATGSAVPINVAASAAGVQEISSNDDRINAEESLVVSYDQIVFSVIGTPTVGMVDPASLEAQLSTFRLSAFDDGVDSFTYTGIGAPPTVSVDVAARLATLDFGDELQDGDSFIIAGGSNSDFRAQFISNRGSYDIIPEPTVLALMAVSLVGTVCTWRER